MSVSSAVQVEVEPRSCACGGGNATLGASYQSSLVRGNMSTFVPSSPATHLQAGVRESGADKKGKRDRNRNRDRKENRIKRVVVSEVGRAAVNNERASVPSRHGPSLLLSFSCSSTVLQVDKQPMTSAHGTV